MEKKIKKEKIEKSKGKVKTHKTEVKETKPVAKKTRPARKKVQASTVTFGLHNLAVPKGAHKKKKLLGRGSSSGHGKTSTRGSKGQTSRAGRHFYIGFEGGTSPLIRRMPKRGFTNIFKKEYQIINLGQLDKIKEAIVSIELLAQKGLIKDKAKLVKVLGDGTIGSAKTIQAHAFSKRASAEIIKAGGKTEIINA